MARWRPPLLAGVPSPAAGIRAELVEVDLTELDLGRRFNLVGTVNAVLPAFDAGG